MDRRAYSQENRNQRADSAAKTVVISPKAEAETPNPTGIKGLLRGFRFRRSPPVRWPR